MLKGKRCGVLYSICIVQYLHIFRSIFGYELLYTCGLLNLKIDASTVLLHFRRIFWIYSFVSCGGQGWLGVSTNSIFGRSLDCQRMGRVVVPLYAIPFLMKAVSDKRSTDGQGWWCYSIPLYAIPFSMKAVSDKRSVICGLRNSEGSWK